MYSIQKNKKKVIKDIFFIVSLLLILNYVKEENLIYQSKNEEVNKICFSQVKLKRESKSEPITDKKSMEQEILSAANVNRSMFQVSVGGECYGYITSQVEGKKILNRVGQIYLEKSNIDINKVTELDVEGKINYIPALVSVSNLSDVDNIAQKIYEENQKNNFINVNFKIIDEETEVIVPSTKSIDTTDMYIGENKVIEGKSGEKQVLKEIQYTNGVRVKEEQIDEKVTSEVIDRVVYKGIKDPIQDEYAFLDKPTRGWTVTSNFGPRWGKNHNGMDIAGNIGDPVVATFDGVVKLKYYDRGYGNVIFLEHENGMETIYGHLNDFNIEQGQTVKKGDLIGFVGNTGRSTGPHLHFELRLNGKAVDPQKYIT